MDELYTEGLMTRTQLAERLSVSTDTLFKWARLGYGPTPVRLGGRVRYREGEVLEFMAGLTTAEPAG